MSSGSSKTSSQQQQPQSLPPTYTSGASGSSNTSSQTFTPWGAAMPTYDRMAQLTQYMGAQNPQWVGPSAQTQQAQQAMYSGLPGQAQAANTAMGNYNRLSNAADVANNPYVQGMMGVNNYNTSQQLKNEWLPAITNRAIASGSGGMGSSREGLAQGQAIGNASQQLSNANAGLLNTAYGQGLQAQLGALSGLGGLQQGMMAPAQALYSAGQAQEGYQQNQLNAPWQQLQNMGAALQYTNPLGTLQGSGTGRNVTDSGPTGTWDPYTMQRTPPAAPQYQQYYAQQWPGYGGQQSSYGAPQFDWGQQQYYPQFGGNQ